VSLSSLTLFDYSDRELLLLIIDKQHDAEGGYVSTNDIAAAVGIEGKRKLNSTGVRLSVLKRFGALEKDPEPKNGTRWRVTHKGEAIAKGKLRAAAQKQLDGLDEGALIEVTRILTDRYQRGDATASNMIRREWLRGTRKAV
jgi:hypothetical protein